MQLTRQQQQLVAQKMNNELDRVIMSWDNELREWHPIALEALQHASALSLGIPQHKFIELFNEEKQGLNMNIVMVLCNNIEARTPLEMGHTAPEWAHILLLNSRVANRWTELATPVQQRVVKEFEIMANKPKMVIAEA